MRRHVAGTGWKMNNPVAATRAYAARLAERLATLEREGVRPADLDLFVLPPFTSLHAAAEAFAGLPVGIGAQTMHWEEAGAWTGEISGAMLAEAGCSYVALAHSERLAHFGETYDLVRLKVNAAMRYGLTPVLCLGETADDKAAGRSDAVLAAQVATALADQPSARVPDVILAYEPRWAIGSAAAASPDYVAERHAAIRADLAERHGEGIAAATRVVYGGAVTPQNGPALVALDDVDGLFVGRAAWSPDGLAEIIAIVAQAAARKAAPIEEITA